MATKEQILRDDPLCKFLYAHAQKWEVLHDAEWVLVKKFWMPGGDALVLKVTLESRATYEQAQIRAEVRAARCLPVSHRLSPLLAWRTDSSGNVVAISQYAGHSVEALLQTASASGGWSDLELSVALHKGRYLMAGILLGLDKMGLMLHHDLKPANVTVHNPGSTSGPIRCSLLDFGAATHVASLRSPGRGTIYPVVSMEHLDAALVVQISPANAEDGESLAEYAADTLEGCLQAISTTTDIFSAGLMLFKLLVGRALGLRYQWDSDHYAPWDPKQERQYFAVMKQLYSELEFGYSTDPAIQAVLQQLPGDCLSMLMRLCAVNPENRPSVKEALRMPFVAEAVAGLTAGEGSRDAEWQASRQHIIAVLQDIPEIKLATKPNDSSSSNTNPIHSSSRDRSYRGSDNSCSAQTEAVPRAAVAGCNPAAAVVQDATSSTCSCDPPPGFMHKVKQHTALQQQQRQVADVQPHSSASNVHKSYPLGRMLPCPTSMQQQPHSQQQHQHQHQHCSRTGDPAPGCFHKRQQDTSLLDASLQHDSSSCRKAPGAILSSQHSLEGSCPPGFSKQLLRAPSYSQDVHQAHPDRTAAPFPAAAMPLQSSTATKQPSCAASGLHLAISQDNVDTNPAQPSQAGSHDPPGCFCKAKQDCSPPPGFAAVKQQHQGRHGQHDGDVKGTAAGPGPPRCSYTPVLATSSPAGSLSSEIYQVAAF